MNTSSNIGVKNTPQSEQLYLSRNSWLSISISLMLLFNFTALLLEATSLDSLAISFVIIAIRLILLIIVFVLIYKVIISSRQISRSSFLFGYLKDEFLEHTNNKGYKYGFMVMILGSFFIGFVFDIFLSETDSLSFKEMGVFCSAIGFFTYGATVLYYLKASDDE